MKILITADEGYYLIDLAKEKTKTLKEVIVGAADDELATIELDKLPTTDLDALFRKALTPVVAPAPRPATRTRASSGSGRTPEELAHVRTWAKEQGLEVADKGRISSDILAKFDAAQA